MGIFDGALVLVDPSGSLLATKKALDQGAEAMAASKPAEASSERTRQADETGTKVCCNVYQIQDGFLINTNTGVVWKYDQESNSFQLVPKEETDLQKAANGLLGLLVGEELHTAKAKAFEDYHHTMTEKFDDKFQTMIKLLDPTP